jgi:hypothetical protein
MTLKNVISLTFFVSTLKVIYYHCMFTTERRKHRCYQHVQNVVFFCKKVFLCVDTIRQRRESKSNTRFP